MLSNSKLTTNYSVFLNTQNKKNKSLVETLQVANQTIETQVEELSKKLQEVRYKRIFSSQINCFVFQK